MALNPTQRMAILALHRGGLSIRVIASATGFSPTTVQKYLAEWSTIDDDTLLVQTKTGTDGKRRPSRRVDTTERDFLIRSLYWQGKLLAAIGEQVGCSIGTVHRVIKATQHPAGP